MKPENIITIIADLRRLGIPVAEDLLLPISYDQQHARIQLPVSELTGSNLASRLTLILERCSADFSLARYILTIFDKRWLTESPGGVIAIAVFGQHENCPKLSLALGTVIQVANTLHYRESTLANMLHSAGFIGTCPPTTS